MQVLPQTCQGATQRSFHGSVYRDLAVEPCRRVAMEVFIATLPGSLYRDLAMEPCRGVGMQVFTVNLPWSQGEELPWKCLPQPCRGAMQRSYHGGSSLHLVSHRRCLPTGVAVGEWGKQCTTIAYPTRPGQGRIPALTRPAQTCRVLSEAPQSLGARRRMEGMHCHRSHPGCARPGPWYA